MSIESVQNSAKNGFRKLLAQNPNISNASLECLIKANMRGFKGHVQVSDQRAHPFQRAGSGIIQLPAKKIYLSPYGFYSDLFVSILRFFIGISFTSFQGPNTLKSYLEQGRRLTFFCALGTSDVDSVKESNQQSLPVRIYQAIFSR